MDPLYRRTMLLGGVGALLGACASVPGVQTDISLRQLLQNHTRARGGSSALDAVRSMRNEAEVSEPTYTADARYIAAGDGRMRVDVFLGDRRAFSEGVDGAGAWSWDGGAAAPVEATPLARAALFHGVEFNLYGLHAFPARGHRLALEGREVIDGVNYYVLKVRMSDGFETYRYIDPVSWLATRKRDVRALHPDVDPTTRLLETQESDFRPVAGVMSSFAWTQRDVAHNAVLQTGTVHSLEYNPPLAAAAFMRSTP